MIVAKAVIPNQYWILRQDDRKIGNIEAGPDGYQVRIDNQVHRFKTIRMMKQRVPIDFEAPTQKKPAKLANEVNGYHTTGRPYNAIYDVRHQVPLWTREPRSKSWYAAGWYRVKQGRTWSVIECPKLIMLDRYQYQGPFRTQAEAESQ
jgi:hypothetical protein